MKQIYTLPIEIAAYSKYFFSFQKELKLHLIFRENKTPEYNKITGCKKMFRQVPRGRIIRHFRRNGAGDDNWRIQMILWWPSHSRVFSREQSFFIGSAFLQRTSSWKRIFPPPPYGTRITLAIIIKRHERKE